MRVLLRVGFDGLGGAAVAVAFAQHGVHGRAFDLVVARLDVASPPRCLDRPDSWQGKSLFLQFGNGRLQLRNGSTDVGELDNVGFRCFGQRTQLGQGVVGGLVLRQHLSHGSQDAAAQRDVTRFHRHACFGASQKASENDGKKAVGCQGNGCLVRKGVKNLRASASTRPRTCGRKCRKTTPV